MPLATVCVQCNLKAFVEDRGPEVFDETTAAHMARVHPDPIQTLHERLKLQQRAAVKLGIADYHD